LTSIYIQVLSRIEYN